MAAPPRLFPAILVTLLVLCHCKAATLPDSVLSAHGKTVQEMMPHGLDLADLSLPAEVIIEALFTQTDLLQDKIEQCEEKVRINLKSNDAAETEGLEVDDKEEDDDSDDDDDGEDTLDKKIAQLAVDAFNHDDDEEEEEDSDDLNPHEASEKVSANDKDVVNAAAGNQSEEANSTVSEHRDDSHKDQKDAGEVEYVVYEYEDVAGDQQNEDEQNKDGQNKDGQNKDGQNEDEQSAEQKTAHENKVSKEENGDDKEKNTGKDAGDDHSGDPKGLSHSQKDPQNGNKQQGQESPATNSPDVGRSKGSAAQMDSINSDAEEPQSPPQEVNISNTITSDNHSNAPTPPSKNSKSIAKQVLVQGEAVTQHPASVGTGTTPATIAASSETTSSRGRQGVTTSRVPKPRASTAGRPPAPTAKPKQAGDNHSEGRRNKRSLSLDQVVMTNTADSGMVRDVRKVTFGQGRIRRRASPQEDIKSWLLEHTGDEQDEEEDREPSLDILNKMLTTVLHAGLRGENSESLDFPLSQVSSLNYPTLQKPGRFMGADDVFDSEKQTDKNLHDILNMADKASVHDVTNMAEQSPARDVLKAAKEFLNKHKTLQAEGNTRDWLEVQRLLATSRLPKGAERIRRRRSLLGRGSSPERYVPLIDQLVERLNYLQHSVQVCHMLLPRQHAPANHTLP